MKLRRLNILFRAGCGLLLGMAVLNPDLAEAKYDEADNLATRAAFEKLKEELSAIPPAAEADDKTSAADYDDGSLGYDKENDRFNFTESNRKDLVRVLGGECFPHEITDKVEVLHSVAERVRKTAEEGWGLYGGKTLRTILTAPGQYPGYYDIAKWNITEENAAENEFIVNFVCDKLEKEGLENCRRVFYNAGNHYDRMQQFSVGYNWGKRRILAEDGNQYCPTAKQWGREITQARKVMQESEIIK